MKTKRLENDLARIRSVIEGDRKNVSADAEKMLKYDLTCVLRGYFEMCSTPEIEMIPIRGGIGVKIRLNARSVKSAGVRAADGGIIA